MRGKITVLGTLFRDGMQQKGMRITTEKALEIIKLKSELGLSYIELGFAGSNGSTSRLIEEALKLDLGQTKIAAFGRTRKAKERVSESSDIREILRLKVPTAVLVAKSRLMDVEKSLGTDAGTNLEMISDSIRYLKKCGLEVIIDLEHAMDAWNGRVEYGKRMDATEKEQSRGYFLQVVNVAIEAGADVIVVCDTNGGSSPEEVSRLFSLLTETSSDIVFGIHAHNDNELAVANTRAAVLHGALHIQGVCGGYGERCGNANLFSVIPRLQLKDGVKLVSTKSLERFTAASRRIASAFNRESSDRAPWVGNLAFTTFAGMHGDSEEKAKGSYLQDDPSAVGNKSHIGLNENSGKSIVYSLAKHLGIKLTKQEVERFLEAFGQDVERGRFEAGEASFVVACQELLLGARLFFDVRSCYPQSRITKRQDEEESACEMNVIWQGRKRAKRISEIGEGQFDAMFQALQKALDPVFPELGNVKLRSYNLHALKVAEEGTSAYVRVVTQFSANGYVWTTSGVHRSSRRADLMALEDAFKWFLLQKRGVPKEGILA